MRRPPQSRRTRRESIFAPFQANKDSTRIGGNMTRQPPMSPKLRRSLFENADFVFSLTVLSLFVVMFWRGAWELMDEVIYPPRRFINMTLHNPAAPSYDDDPKHKEISAWICLITGLAVRIISDFVQHRLGGAVFYLNGGGVAQRCLAFLVSRSFIVINSLSVVGFWRGLWYLSDTLTGHGFAPEVGFILVSIAVLAGLSVSRNLVTSPLAVSVDRHDVTFKATTFFGRKSDDEFVKYFLDVVFSQCFIQVLIILCWWSNWSMEDKVLGQEKIAQKEQEVAWPSVALGYSCSLLAYGLQFVYAWISEQRTIVRSGAHLLVVWIGFLGAFNIWRGMWSVMDHFFPLSDPTHNRLASLLVGLAGLLCCNCLNSIAGRSILFDRPTHDGEKIFITKYFTLFFLESSFHHEELVPIIE